MKAMAMRPLTISASLSPLKVSTGSAAGPSVAEVIHTWLAQPFTLFSGAWSASGSGGRSRPSSITCL